MPNQDGPSHDQLWSKAKAGDDEATRQLIVSYQDRLRSRIRLMLGEEARRQAESIDFCQQVVMDALKGLDRFEWRSEQQLLRWLTTIARNNITDTVRKKRARAFESLSISWDGQEGPEADIVTPSSQADRNERVYALVEAMEQLPDNHRTVIELRNLENLRFREIGETMNKNEEAARKLYTRAMVQLGRLMSTGDG